MKTLLAVDVGGTKAELALFDLRGQGLEPDQRSVVPCASYSGIEEILKEYLAGSGARPDFACIGVAGVVDEGRAKITNLPWTLDEQILVKKFAFVRVKLINDMTALAAVLTSLESADLQTLQQGQEQKEEVKAVIAPGTGLGEGYLIETGSVFLPKGSEGGHADFAPVDDEQRALLTWLERDLKPVSYEMLCSGMGIPTLYDFLKDQGKIAETEAIRQQLHTVRDRTPVIIDGAVSQDSCPLCGRTIELFLSILGSEAGNLALKLYALGGLYIGGGLLPRLAGRLSFAPFIQAFGRKEKMAHLMARIPVKLVLKRDAVLCGAAVFGRRYFLEFL
jgi:glucokinase